MLVLMDMEWIENKRHFFCPTQISAMRVDSRWRCLDRFDALIKPYDTSCQQWDHIAYSGAESEAFLSADPGPLVFLNLYKWLRYDDVLCWWVDQPALVFQKIVENLLHRNVDHSMRMIYPAWKKDTTDSHLKAGSPYLLAQDRGIFVPAVEHSSANDVEAIRALLRGTATSPEVIQSSFINLKARIMTQADFQKRRTKGQAPGSDSPTCKLFYDTTKKLLHTANCPELKSTKGMQGFDTYIACIKKGLKPCRCCREEYWQENWKQCQQIIKSGKFNYISRLNGELFHRTNCIHARKIPFMELRGGIYYDNCLKNGYKPCGWCKPSIEQQIIETYVYPQHSDKENQPDYLDAVLLTTRKLTREEKNAIRRHDEAQRERDLFLKDERDKTAAERRDEYTLTQSGYAFWAAAGYQTFHLRHCTKLGHLSELRGFARYKDAIRAGLFACKQCKPTPKNDIKVSVPIYHRERQDESVETLDRLCNAQGFSHHYEEPDYYIETAVGKWRLDTTTHPVDVYHINLAMSPDEIYYHKQHRLFLSLTDTFEYIRRHENSLMAKLRAKAEKNLCEKKEDPGTII